MVDDNIPDELADPENILCCEFDNGSAGKRAIDALSKYGFIITSTADRDAIREAMEEARAHIIDGPEPPSWSSEVVAKLTAALALIGEG